MTNKRGGRKNQKEVTDNSLEFLESLEPRTRAKDRSQVIEVVKLSTSSYSSGADKRKTSTDNKENKNTRKKASDKDDPQTCQTK